MEDERGMRRGKRGRSRGGRVGGGGASVWGGGWFGAHEINDNDLVDVSFA